MEAGGRGTQRAPQKQQREGDLQEPRPKQEVKGEQLPPASAPRASTPSSLRSRPQTQDVGAPSSRGALSSLPHPSPLQTYWWPVPPPTVPWGAVCPQMGLPMPPPGSAWQVTHAVVTAPASPGPAGWPPAVPRLPGKLTFPSPCRQPLHPTCWLTGAS